MSDLQNEVKMYEDLSLKLKEELDKIDGKCDCDVMCNRDRIIEARQDNLPGIDSDKIKEYIKDMKILYKRIMFRMESYI